MPDNNLHPTFAAILDQHTKPAATPVAHEQCDGFIVVTRFRRDRPAVPPGVYDYSYTEYKSLADAHEHYSDAENNELGRWEPVAILPCRNGVPLGAKVILP
jgi:hypothetical protein